MAKTLADLANKLYNCSLSTKPGLRGSMSGSKTDSNESSNQGVFRITRRQFVTSSAAVLVSGGFTGEANAVSALTRERSAPGTSDLANGRGPSRVIIDTDPGIDDAFALLLAMRSPELKIEAITPVAGNVPLDFTLPNALRLVEIAGRTDIPVAAGAKAPLVRRLVTGSYVHGENGLDGTVFPDPTTKPVATPAAELICEIVRKYPGEVTLIPIGPLTNIATALASDPELAGKVRGVVMMGGSLSGGNITPAAEFNIYVDPEAARIVFQSGIPITMVGLDVTRKATLTDEHVRRFETGKNPASQAAAKIGHNAINHNREHGYLVGPNMHDSLAIAGFLDPSILTLQDYYVDVETTGELTAGETVGYSPVAGDLRRRPGMGKDASTMNMPIRGSAPTLVSLKTSPVIRDKFVPNTKVAVEVDSPKFFELLIGRLSGNQ
jgi:inosine-uridine nucleoside N-ribohydrolase